jgi:uncharacterized protein YjiS (DUF1127 family)
MEVAMKDTPALAPHQAALPATPVEPAAVSSRHLPTLRSIIATWEERKRLRWELQQMSKDNPYLIDDIGLTRRQVEAEIAKPFWQA